MQLAITGDLLVTTDLREHRTAGRLDGLAAWLARADATIGNLETVVHDYQFAPAARSGGTWLRAPREALQQLTDMGIRAVSVANNHSCDYGTDGMMNTIESAHAAGIGTAGGGRSLSDAASPTIFDIDGHTVGIVAAATSAPLETAASDMFDGIAARPGIFRIATSEHTLVPDVHYERIAELSRLFDNETPHERLVYDGTVYVRGDKLSLVSEPHPDDLALLTRAVEVERLRSDVVTVSLHSHEGNGRWEDPSDALVALAHAAVDAGASVVWCHGPHLVRGVERRGDALIFYSLGSLFFQLHGVDRQPAAARRSVGLPADAPLSEVRSRRFDYLAREAYREAIVPIIEWREGRIASVRITPFILDDDDAGGTYGLPRSATADEAKTVAGRMSDLSTSWGTKLRAKDGTIRLDY